MSHWQKTKLKHKEGTKKKEIENHFGIKTLVSETKKMIKEDPQMFKKLKDTKKSKKKSK